MKWPYPRKLQILNKTLVKPIKKSNKIPKAQQ